MLAVIIFFLTVFNVIIIVNVIHDKNILEKRKKKQEQMRFRFGYNKWREHRAIGASFPNFRKKKKVRSQCRRGIFVTFLIIPRAPPQQNLYILINNCYNNVIFNSGYLYKKTFDRNKQYELQLYFPIFFCRN